MVNNMKKLIVLAALLAACSKGKGGADQCTSVAAGAVDRMMGKLNDAPGMPESAKTEMKDKGEKLKAVIAKRCTEDKWPSDVIDCYSKAASMPDIKACRGKLSPELSAKLQSEELQAMMGGGMRPSPDAIQKQLDELTAQLDKAQQDLTNATDDASRVAAKEKVNQIQKQQLVLRAQLERAKSGANPMPMGHPGTLAPPGTPPNGEAPSQAPAPAAGSGSAK